MPPCALRQGAECLPRQLLRPVEEKGHDGCQPIGTLTLGQDLESTPTDVARRHLRAQVAHERIGNANVEAQ